MAAGDDGAPESPARHRSGDQTPPESAGSPSDSGPGLVRSSRSLGATHKRLLGRLRSRWSSELRLPGSLRSLPRSNLRHFGSPFSLGPGAPLLSTSRSSPPIGPPQPRCPSRPPQKGAEIPSPCGSGTGHHRAIASGSHRVAIPVTVEPFARQNSPWRKRYGAQVPEEPSTRGL